MNKKIVVIFATSRFLLAAIRDAIAGCTNYEVKGEASTEDELMRCVESSVPDIVVMTDDVTCLELLKRASDVKVLMITPDWYDKHHETLRRQGANAILVRPFNREHMLQKLRSLHSAD